MSSRGGRVGGNVKTKMTSKAFSLTRVRTRKGKVNRLMVIRVDTVAGAGAVMAIDMAVNIEKSTDGSTAERIAIDYGDVQASKDFVRLRFL